MADNASNQWTWLLIIGIVLIIVSLIGYNTQRVWNWWIIASLVIGILLILASLAFYLRRRKVTEFVQQRTPRYLSTGNRTGRGRRQGALNFPVNEY